MFEVIDGNVMEVREIITGSQTVIYKEFYDLEFHVKLSINKNTILSDGVDKILVVAEIYNYENIFQSTNESMIVFEMGNEKIEVQAVKGKASIEVTSNRVGEIKINASVEGMREGEVILESI